MGVAAADILTADRGIKKRQFYRGKEAKAWKRFAVRFSEEEKMDPITNLLLFPSPSGDKPDKAPTDNYDSTLKVFEEMVDRLVYKKLKDSKARQQSAIEKAKWEAQYQRRIAFLTGAVHQAEVALSGVSSSPHRPLNPSEPKSPAPEALRDFKESQVAFWKAKLIQAGIPDGTTGFE